MEASKSGYIYFFMQKAISFYTIYISVYLIGLILSIKKKNHDKNYSVKFFIQPSKFVTAEYVFS